MIGTILGNYQVVGCVGEGAAGHVYRVRHLALGSEHAIKVLKSRGADLRMRCLQEGRIQSRLRHPNVVAVTDLLDVDGHVGLVMEYVHGPPLREVLERGGPLPQKTSLSLIHHLLAGVGAAHEAGVLHRDLKPGNVLLASGRGDVVAKIIDFGVAKAHLEPVPGLTTLTGAMLGTPGYMAPEQAFDAAGADERADIFSLGVILYQMITGRRPFDGRSSLELLNAVANGNYRPLAPHRAHSCPRLDAAVERALAPDPDLRFQSCEEFAEALGSVGRPFATRIGPPVPGRERLTIDLAARLRDPGPPPPRRDFSEAATDLECLPSPERLPSAPEFVVPSAQMPPAPPPVASSAPEPPAPVEPAPVEPAPVLVDVAAKAPWVPVLVVTPRPRPPGRRRAAATVLLTVVLILLCAGVSLGGYTGAADASGAAASAR